MLPTISAVAGIEVPDRWGLDGVSFAAEILGRGPSDRQWIYCWYHRNGVRDEASQHVRNQRFKLYSNGNFFDLTTDFEENSPLPLDTLGRLELTHYRTLKNVLETRMKVTQAWDGPIREKQALLWEGKTRKPDR
jgi:arylsulfatase A